jgi:hypothetical protein
MRLLPSHQKRKMIDPNIETMIERCAEEIHAQRMGEPTANPDRTYDALVRLIVDEVKTKLMDDAVVVHRLRTPRRTPEKDRSHWSGVDDF